MANKYFRHRTNNIDKVRPVVMKIDNSKFIATQSKAKKRYFFENLETV